MIRLVGIILFDQTSLFTVSCLQEVSSLANEYSHSGGEYQVKLCTIEGGCIQTREDVTLGSSKIADLLPTPVDALIALGGTKHKATLGKRALIELIKKLAARAKRIAFVGAGPFIGAEAGLLSGAKATTHPSLIPEFRTLYPAVKAETVALYSKHDNIWTSTAMTSAIDLALALLEEDLGYPSTIEIARYLGKAGTRMYGLA
jgi:transcriptional regulator GlxA family with amidase domain